MTACSLDSSATSQCYRQYLPYCKLYQRVKMHHCTMSKTTLTIPRGLSFPTSNSTKFSKFQMHCAPITPSDTSMPLSTQIYTKFQ